MTIRIRCAHSERGWAIECSHQTDDFVFMPVKQKGNLVCRFYSNKLGFSPDCPPDMRKLTLQPDYECLHSNKTSLLSQHGTTAADGSPESFWAQWQLLSR